MSIHTQIAQTLARRAALRKRDSRQDRYTDREYCRDLAEATRGMLEIRKLIFRLP